jgi:hypothetical protein
MFSLRRDESSFNSERPVFSRFLGVEVPISIYTDGAEVHPEQLESLTRFLAIEPGQRAALLEPLFADYREVIEAVGEGPEIVSSEQVWEFVRWTNVIVPRQGVGSRFVFVQGDPMWEEEHGVELLFRNERLIRLDGCRPHFVLIILLLFYRSCGERATRDVCHSGRPALGLHRQASYR